ncbi:hypothetical protein [Moorena sp. SIO4G3]|uniref:hypothetical protein n=1 Tax=Moorena sp. SIO4G3 TaxID=2607821 RepID=UPI00142BD957|nr:hypothetical protein [Moorena sp. SIO4G3]NEO81458.1 hypothetical protein [Moorena sp. SIO4G3]
MVVELYPLILDRGLIVNLKLSEQLINFRLTTLGLKLPDKSLTWDNQVVLLLPAPGIRTFLERFDHEISGIF